LGWPYQKRSPKNTGETCRLRVDRQREAGLPSNCR